MHVIKHCTEFRGTSCAPCREGSYQDHNNGREQCFLCKKCDAGLGLKVKKSCTTTSDALCEILEGFFCVDSNRDGCIAAERHLACSPGQYISQRDGTITSCQPHTKCESVGLKLILPGSDSTDSECTELSNMISLVINIVMWVGLATLLLAIGIVMFKRARKNQPGSIEIPLKEYQTTPSSDKSSGSNQEPARRT
ncbi:hypothetical protein CRUP_032391, partial [Coryphaenoides rupestris]